MAKGNISLKTYNLKRNLEEERGYLYELIAAKPASRQTNESQPDNGPTSESVLIKVAL